MFLDKILPFASWAILFSVSAIQAQHGTTAAGGEATSAAGTVSFSVGQVTYATYENQDGTAVSAGVQQTYQIFTGAEDIMAGLNIHLIVFPNPTRDMITLRMDQLPNEPLQYQLFDNTGRRLLNHPITASDSPIDMNMWPAATYHLRIMAKDQVVKSFKIIKTS